MDLEHPKIVELTRAAADALELPMPFLNLVFREEAVPSCFSYRVEHWNSGWTSSVPDGAAVAYPLWACSADQLLLIVSHDGGRRAFVVGSHEGSEVCLAAYTSQGVLAHLFNSLYEDEVAIDALESAAAYVGFEHLKATIAFAERHGAARHWSMRHREFIASIDRRHGWNGREWSWSEREE